VNRRNVVTVDHNDTTNTTTTEIRLAVPDSLPHLDDAAQTGRLKF